MVDLLLVSLSSVEDLPSPPAELIARQAGLPPYKWSGRQPQPEHLYSNLPSGSYASPSFFGYAKTNSISPLALNTESLERVCGYTVMEKWRKGESPWTTRNPLSVFTEETGTATHENEGEGFLASARHHSHYFSNLDLFADTGFNYLKYAKYNEVRDASTSRSPHLRISQLSVSLDIRSALDRALLRLPKRIHILQEISLDLVAGDIMAVMYTSEKELRSFLQVLSGSRLPSAKFRGDIHLNGHKIRQTQLEGRAAFVDVAHVPNPGLTVCQYLRIESFYRPPATTAFKVENMIEQLISTLALTPFRNSLCGKLGRAERMRLLVAAQVLRDTEILVCSMVTSCLDVYDVALLVDYLREWAVRLDRIVVMAIAPNTVEILEMFSKVSILASGRLVYSGNASEMSTYFDSISYPCPMFKNPCDYYVDLVTHDHLTSSASRESSKRIDTLSQRWNETAKGRPLAQLHVSPLGGRSMVAGVFGTALNLYRRFWIETCNQPFRRILLEPVVAAIVSILLGLCFIPLTKSHRSGINDRFGLISSIFYFGMLPLLYVWISNVHLDRFHYQQDRDRQYYSSILYLFVKTIFNIPFVLLASTSYAIPVFYFTASPQEMNIAHYILFFLHILMFFLIFRSAATACAMIFSSQLSAFVTIVFLLSVSFLLSGISLPTLDMPWVLQLSRTFSPHYYIGHSLLQQQFMGAGSFTALFGISNATELIVGCERKKILARKIAEVPIYTISLCSKMRGSQILAFHGFPPVVDSNNSFYYVGYVVLLICVVVSFMFLCCSATCRHKIKK